MKKKTGFICLILAMIIVVVVGAISLSNPKRKTLNYFHANKETLISDIEENETPTCSLDLTYNYWNGEHPIVEYIVDNQGIAPSSKYYGFFYSYDGKPVAFQNANIELVPISDTEWEWHGKGDNHGYVEFIEGNWYYFEATS
ncbi:MAG: hypothetical protein Q4A59_05390 [Erysipelotrichaceae bacterium]|nr:hypothetical protein [Erysipelotrichaceae bacterium]